MSNNKLNKAEYMAVMEAILTHTVGIAVDQNRQIGTGNLVTLRGELFVLTARHVVNNADANEIRFFIPPPVPLIEQSMRDGIPEKFAIPYAGEYLTIAGPMMFDSVNDLAAIPIRAGSLFPKHMRFFPIEKAILDLKDDVSVLVLGFPVDNSAFWGDGPTNQSAWKALGLTSENTKYYSASQNKYSLHSAFNQDRHFVLEYTRIEQGGITPPGFSGAGAWSCLSSKGMIWKVEVSLTGLITSWHKRTHLHPDLLQATNVRQIQKLFGFQPTSSGKAALTNS